MMATSFSMPTTVPLITEPSCRFPEVKDSSSIAAKSSREGVAVAAWAMNSPDCGAPGWNNGVPNARAKGPARPLETAAKRRAGAYQPFDRNDDCVVQSLRKRRRSGLSSNDEGRLSRPSARSDGLDDVDGGPDSGVYIQMRRIQQDRILRLVLRGATARVHVALVARARISASTAASSTVSPRPRSSRMRRRARSSGVAVT